MAWTLPRPPATLAVADVALAFARDRVAAQLPGVEAAQAAPARKTLLIGGGIAAGVAALLLKRDRGARAAARPQRRARAARSRRLHAAAGLQLRRGRSGGEHRDRRARPARVRGAGDRRGRRGGRRRGRGRQHRRQVSDYAGPDGELADEAERPVAEAGEGESEGQEQTEAELREAAEPTAPA